MTLNALVRADCTTRNAAKAKQLAARMDELEERIVELAEQEELEQDPAGARRAPGDGVPRGSIPARSSGRLSRSCSSFASSEGPRAKEEAFARLDALGGGTRPVEGLKSDHRRAEAPSRRRLTSRRSATRSGVRTSATTSRRAPTKRSRSCSSY